MVRSGLEWWQDVLDSRESWVFVRRDILTIQSMLEWLLDPPCACVHGMILQHHEGSAVHILSTRPIFPSSLACPKQDTSYLRVCMSYVNDENFLLGQLGPRIQLGNPSAESPQPYIPDLADPIVSLPPEMQ